MLGCHRVPVFGSPCFLCIFMVEPQQNTLSCPVAAGRAQSADRARSQTWGLHPRTAACLTTIWSLKMLNLGKLILNQVSKKTWNRRFIVSVLTTQSAIHQNLAAWGSGGLVPFGFSEVRDGVKKLQNLLDTWYCCCISWPKGASSLPGLWR